MVTVERCQEAGLTEMDIKLVHSPISNLNPGQRAAASAALDKYDAYHRGEHNKK